MTSLLTVVQERPGESAGKRDAVFVNGCQCLSHVVLEVGSAVCVEEDIELIRKEILIGSSKAEFRDVLF